jgi:TonB family protein
MKKKLLFSAILLGFWVFQTQAQPKTKKTIKKNVKPASSSPAPKKEEPRKDNFAVLETQEVRFTGTDDQLVAYFMENVKFDSASVKANAEGEVMLSFMVNADSTISNPQVIRKFGYNVDGQMVELVKKLKFVPAKMNGVVTRSNHMISIPLRAYFP